MSDISDLSVTDDQIGQDGEHKRDSKSKDGQGTKGAKKDKKDKDKHHLGLTGALATAGLSASGVVKKDKKEKKEKKEKETRYAHLGDESSGEDEIEGKSPAKTKKSTKSFMTFGSAKKEKDKKNKDRDSREKDIPTLSQEPSILPANLAISNIGGASTVVVGSGMNTGLTNNNLETNEKFAGYNSMNKQDMVSKSDKEQKKKDKKEKGKLKLKRSKHDESEKGNQLADEAVNNYPIFGVALEVAVERNRCYDGVPLPMVVRQCIDHIEEYGLNMEGVYRSSGVKSKVNKLRNALNSRSNSINLSDYDPTVVASVLKQFLRELPDPVLTYLLMPKFEEVSASSNPQTRIEGMKRLIAQLPDCNRTLLQWIFVHMGHVIERERFNKMTLQNVSIVLSPTMKISHRVLNCLFENSHILFEGIYLKKYIPPITGDCGESGTQTDEKLPDSLEAIQEEIKKQESLLADLHLQISSGAASKKTEEQVWEQQRIVTQLKRKLRTANKKSECVGALPVASIPDEEEKLDFTLQVAAVSKEDVSRDVHFQRPNFESSAATNRFENTVKQNKSVEKDIASSAAPDMGLNGKRINQAVLNPLDQRNILVTTEASRDNNRISKGTNLPLSGINDSSNQTANTCKQNAKNDSSLPRERFHDQNLNVTTHQRQKSLPSSNEPADSSFQSQIPETRGMQKVQTSIPQSDQKESTKPVAKGGHVTVIQLNPTTEETSSSKIHPISEFKDSSDTNQNSASTTTTIKHTIVQQSKAMIPLLPKPPGKDNKTAKIRQHNPILQPTLVSTNIRATIPVADANTRKQNKNEVLQTTLKVNDNSEIFKTKSLPRGMPSDFESMNIDGHLQSTFAPKFTSNSQTHYDIQDVGSGEAMPSLNPFPAPKPTSKDAQATTQENDEEERRIEELQLELLRVKFENEELEALKGELEWRKRSERKEMEELREEMATMQTLYQYRTYSVDSSENSSDEGSDKDNVREEAEELGKILSDLKRENKELEDKRAELCKKIQDERTACINLRVQIKVEQERIDRRRLGLSLSSKQATN